MNQTAMAAVNLKAVLRTLEKLPELDPKSKQLLEHVPLTLQFKAANVGSVRLKLGNGKIEFFPGGGPADMSLGFPMPNMVNKMFEGKGIPVPLKGFTKLKYLTGTFTEITDRLSYYLRPTPQLLQDPEFARINSLLTLHVAVYAMAEIANHDPKGVQVAKGMCDGTIGLKIANGPALTMVINDHQARIVDGDEPKAAGPHGRHAFMVFSDLDTTGQVLRGELASYPAIGRELIKLGGYVPLLDNMNKILGMVPFYLS